MKNDELLDVILDEQRFPFENMTLDERNYYLNIIKSCKDICDSNNKVDGKGKCEIVELRFKRHNNAINVNGFLGLGTENRCIAANIFLEKNKIIVYMEITRLVLNGKSEVYTVLDKFTLENDTLKRISKYNYDMNSLCDNVENEKMKGKLK